MRRKKKAFYRVCISRTCWVQLLPLAVSHLILMVPLPPPQHLTFKVNGFWEEKPNAGAKPWSCAAVNWITECACFLRAQSWPISRLGLGHGLVLNPSSLCAIGHRIQPHKLLVSESVLKCREVYSKQGKFTYISRLPSIYFGSKIFHWVLSNTRKVLLWKQPLNSWFL